MPWSRDRATSFAKYIKEAGYKTHFYKRPRSKALRSWENEQGRVAEWLRSLPRPIGLMACNDECGQNVIEACKQAGFRVPEEVAVIGVDNDELVCDLSDPPLSSVALNTERAGYEAAELLDKLMHGEEMNDQVIIDQATHIATRQSTDMLSIGDHDVAKAVNYIRRHARQTIRVSDVVAATTTSRRGLQQRFRKVLGRSVHDEIRRVRIQQVMQMLVETNLPVSRIARMLGYTGFEHISRYFRQEMSMSPLTYRKKFGGK